MYWKLSFANWNKKHDDDKKMVKDKGNDKNSTDQLPLLFAFKGKVAFKSFALIVCVY